MDRLSPSPSQLISSDSASTFNLNIHPTFPLMHKRAVTGFFAGSEWGALLLITNGASNIQLYQIDPQSFSMVKIAECYLGANVLGLERLRIESNPKDYILAALEGGAILILEYNPQNVTFELVDQERYQATFNPWLLWGRNMVSDWKSRNEFVLGNVENCKIVYILIDPSETKLSIALPTVDAIPTSIIYSLVSVESSWRNPIFACLEAYCPERPNILTATSAKPGLATQQRDDAIIAGDKMLVFYELDMEQNQVFRRWDVQVESTANLVIPVPCKSGTGSGGVLVCRRNIIQWLNERRSPQSVPVPRHPSLTLDVDVFLVSFTTVTYLQNSPQMILAQSIFGDVYLIEFNDDVLSIKFFDSIPQAEQLFLLSNRFLVAYSLFEYPCVYYLLSIGDDPDQPIYTSLEHTEPEEAFFRPRPLRHLTSTIYLEQQQIARSATLLNHQSRFKFGNSERRYRSPPKTAVTYSASLSKTTYTPPSTLSSTHNNDIQGTNHAQHMSQQTYTSHGLYHQSSSIDARAQASPNALISNQVSPNAFISNQPSPSNHTSQASRPSYIPQHPFQPAIPPHRQLYSIHQEQQQFVSSPPNFSPMYNHSAQVIPANMSRQSSLASRQSQLFVGSRTTSLRRPKSHQITQVPNATTTSQNNQQQHQHRMLQPTMLNKRFSSLRRHSPQGSRMGSFTPRDPKHLHAGVGPSTSLSTLVEENCTSVNRTTSIDSGYPSSIPHRANSSSIRSQSMPELIPDGPQPASQQSAKDTHLDEIFNAVSTSVFIASDSSPASNSDTSEKILKQLELRSYVCTEVYETEKTYRESLSIILTQFKVPLENKKVVPSVFIRLVFTGVQALLDFSAIFASKLQKLIDGWDDRTSQLAPLFLEHREDFSVFLKFVDNYSNALNMVRRAEESNEQFKLFNDQCKRNRDTNRQQLQDFLILPIQRATRYPLLLKDVRKHTPINHPDTEGLISALTMMNELAAQVNHVKQQEEEMTRMFAMFKHVEGCPPIVIKYSRRLIMEVDVHEVTGMGAAAGSVGLTALGNLVSSSKHHQYRIYLMSDLLLMARVNKKKTKFVRLIDLADLVVEERGAVMVSLVIQQGSVSTSSTTLNAKVAGKLFQSFGGAVRGVNEQSGSTRDLSLPSSYLLSLADEKVRHNFILAIGAKMKSTREQRAQEGGVFSLPRTAGAVSVTTISQPTVPPITVPVSSANNGSSVSLDSDVKTTTPCASSPSPKSLVDSNEPPSPKLSSSTYSEVKPAKRTSFTLNVSAHGSRSNTNPRSSTIDTSVVQKSVSELTLDSLYNYTSMRPSELGLDVRLLEKTDTLLPTLTSSPLMDVHDEPNYQDDMDNPEVTKQTKSPANTRLQLDVNEPGTLDVNILKESNDPNG